MGDKSEYHLARYRPIKHIGVKNIDFWFLAYIDSIDSIVLMYAFELVKSVLEVI